MSGACCREGSGLLIAVATGQKIEKGIIRMKLLFRTLPALIMALALWLPAPAHA